MATEKIEAKKTANSGKLGLILKLVFIGLNVVVCSGGLYLAYKGTIGWNPPVYTDEVAMERIKIAQAEIENLPLIFTMDPFKANLSDNPVRGIEVEVSVEMVNREGYEELIDSDSQAKARDEILRVLQSKTYDDVSTVQGKLFLKDQVSVSLNGLLKKGIVKDIYFSQFKIE